MAAKQGVSVPAFVTDKSPSTKKKKLPNKAAKRTTKRFKSNRPRAMYHMDQHTWGEEDYDGQQNADWEEDDVEEDKGSSALAGTHWPSSRKASFHPALRRIARQETFCAHSYNRSLLQTAPAKRKGITSRRESIFFFTKGKGKSKGKTVVHKRYRLLVYG
jgi:hypothetical protein